MNAPHPLCQTAMPVQHTPDVVCSLCLSFQLSTSIHQMSGVQQNPFPRKADSLQQPGRLLRFRKGKAWPPLIFHQEFKRPSLLAKNEVHHLYRRVNDLLVGVQPAVGISLLQRYVRHMEDHITGAQVHRPP